MAQSEWPVVRFNVKHEVLTKIIGKGKIGNSNFLFSLYHVLQSRSFTVSGRNITLIDYCVKDYCVILLYLMTCNCFSLFTINM